MMHMHASKTYSHSGGKGPAPPVPSLQTQQSAPHRLINDNVQVTSKYDTFFLLKTNYNFTQQIGKFELFYI